MASTFKIFQEGKKEKIDYSFTLVIHGEAIVPTLTESKVYHVNGADSFDITIREVMFGYQLMINVYGAWQDVTLETSIDINWNSNEWLYFVLDSNDVSIINPITLINNPQCQLGGSTDYQILVKKDCIVYPNDNLTATFDITNGHRTTIDFNTPFTL